MICKRFFQISACFWVLISPASAQDVQRPQPEISTGTSAVNVTQSQDFMIVTANPYATDAGYEILKKGGSAVDAAIAAQLVLGLTEPQSSGLGGGAFVLHYDAKSKELNSYDGRETAPRLAGPHLFQDDNGEPMKFFDAVIGGRAVGVPGTPALLAAMHEKHGALTWMEIFDDAIRLAEDGFIVSPRMAKMVKDAGPRLKKASSQSAVYFLPKGQPVEAGTTLKNTAYAETLKEFAFYGAHKFYGGVMPAAIIREVQNYRDNPGLLTLEDFAEYKVKTREPVCGPYRTYVVCSMNEPSSGGLTILQTLGMIEGFGITNDARGWSIIAQASALAFADRNKYIADPDFVDTPGRAMIAPKYLKTRASLIDPDKALDDISAGIPQGWESQEQGSPPDITRPGTSHISVVDGDGNIVSMTTTIEGAFGSHLMANGYLLNNELTDFAFSPNAKDGSPIANRVQGGKRPRSSMAPTIVFDHTGEPVLVIGSAGGSRIIGYVLQRIIALIDWGMSVEDALAMPHVLARGKTVELEEGSLQSALQDRGHQVRVGNLNSGLTAIHRVDNIWRASADPRREGTAKGD